MDWKEAKNIISRDSHLKYISNEEAKLAHELATDDIKGNDSTSDFLEVMTRCIEVIRNNKL